MSDMINRQDAIDALIKMLSDCFYADEEVLDAVKTTLNELPPAQSEPQQRKTGKWIDGQCSICGCDVPAYIIDWKWQKDIEAKFCPNCGARMEVTE